MKKETMEGPEQMIKKEDEEARDEELLVLKRVLSQQRGVKDGPSNHSPTPPISQTLKQTLCQSIPEPLREALNSELRAYEEVVRSKSKKSPTYTIQISKGNVRTSVSKIKRDLFAWLILFQPELKQEDKVIT